MPYFVKNGGVRSRGVEYGVGDELPPGIGDKAMVEVGAIEWREESGAPSIAVATVVETAPQESPTDSEPDLDAMKMPELRKVAKAAGVNSFGVKKPDLIKMLKGGED